MQENKFKITLQQNPVNSTINILMYTAFWGDTYWLRDNEAGLQNAPELLSCEKKNCIFTAQKKLLLNIDNFDALIFHHAQGWTVDGSLWNIPRNRSSKQYYIFAADEYAL